MSNGLTRRELEITDINKIIEILDKSLIAHIGMVDGDEPYVVPMNYGYTMTDGKLTLYLHGARKGRKIDIMKANPKVFFETECDIQPFEGEVACKYGMAYASIMGKGIAEIVEDVEEKKNAMSIIMKTQTGKDFTFEDKMVSFVNIIRIDVSSYTAKHRPIPKK
ncbi:MAG: pyridoxamine 5'-phosphate oxidase family protein [Clostridia bacterium]|nr:pyridoxamine 5'-phosphate oxidase family protein [Clostridia bacterium]